MDGWDMDCMDETRVWSYGYHESLGTFLCCFKRIERDISGITNGNMGITYKGYRRISAMVIGLFFAALFALVIYRTAYLLRFWMGMEMWFGLLLDIRMGCGIFSDRIGDGDGKVDGIDHIYTYTYLYCLHFWIFCIRKGKKIWSIIKPLQCQCPPLGEQLSAV
jgi:hypothetical protein